MTYFDNMTLELLHKSQWFTETEMYELRLKGLQDLLKQAREHTKYYKDIPEVKGLEDINKLPLLTKEIIHDKFEELTTDNIAYKAKWTGGTCQVVNIRSPENFKPLYTGKNRFLEWQGIDWRIKNKEAVLWGLGELERDSKIYHAQVRDEYLYLPIEHLKTKNDAIKYLRMIKDFKPVKIRGYPSALTTLAYYALEEDIEYIPQVIETNCEPLTSYKKELIDKAFKAPIFVFYGSQDLGSMAQDCDKHEGLHFFAERYIIERADDGRLLWTDLLNYAMPMIRYENGDEGSFVQKKCSCGRALPMINETLGRTLYFLLTKDDKWINMTELHEHSYWSVPYFLRLVDCHQVVQTEKGECVFTLKVWDINDKPDMRFLIERFKKQRLDITIKWTVNKEDIKLSPSGKLISCITRFKPPWLGKETESPELR